jgi:ribosomal-protein-alanine N-acetyltransferase
MAAAAGREFGKWAVVEKESGRLVGSCGFDPPSERMPEVEFGYLFARDRWGKGYATEAGHACMRFAFEELRLARVVARVVPEHTLSRRVLEKLGFEFEGLRVFEGAEEPDAFYVARNAGG